MLAIVVTFDICTLWGSPHSGRCKVKRSGANWHQYVANVTTNCQQLQTNGQLSLWFATFDI